MASSVSCGATAPAGTGSSDQARNQFTMLISSTTGVANTEIMPHHPRKSVLSVYSEKYLRTQLRQNSPPMRL